MAGRDRDREGIRVIWEAPGGTGIRLIARIWEDGGPPAYAAQYWEGWWRWAETEDEQRHVLVAIARWLDTVARDKEADVS